MLDTIAAISTPRGKGGVALIRISGAGAVAAGDAIFKPKNGKKLSDSPARYSVFGDIYDPRSAGAVDSGLAVVFRAPHSFTGEDTVEISCHGGVLVSAAVLSAALAAGARQAEAGEFTRRAYAAGKLSLAEAESLGMLLDARTDAQLRLARGGMRGGVTRAAEELAGRISAVLSDIYARIDFPDEDLGELSVEEISERVRGIYTDAERLAATYSTGRAIAEGIPTEGHDEAERVGIGRARERIESSELVIFVIDGSREPDENERGLAAGLAERKWGRVVAVLNKSDITGGAAGAVPAARGLWESFPDRVSISAESGEGTDALAAMIGGMFLDASISTETDAVVQNERQHDAVCRAVGALDDAAEVLTSGFSPDIAGIDLEEALSALRAIDGRGVCAEIVDGIFSKFCVGK